MWPMVCPKWGERGAGAARSVFPGGGRYQTPAMQPCRHAASAGRRALAVATRGPSGSLRGQVAKAKARQVATHSTRRPGTACMLPSLPSLHARAVWLHLNHHKNPHLHFFLRSPVLRVAGEGERTWGHPELGISGCSSHAVDRMYRVLGRVVRTDLPLEGSKTLQICKFLKA